MYAGDEVVPHAFSLTAVGTSRSGPPIEITGILIENRSTALTSACRVPEALRFQPNDR